MNPSRRGFTLTELLVVIGIMALLASLLLPAVARIKDSARQSRCGGHLRQLGIAMGAYANDNRGVLPPVKWQISASTTTNWQSLCAGYADASTSATPGWGGVSRASIFKGCPAYTPPAGDPQLGYGMNVFLEYPGNSWCNSPKADGSPFYGNAGVKHFRLPALTHPGNRLLLSEVSGEVRIWGGNSCAYRHRAKRLTSVLFCDGRLQALALSAATLAWADPALLP